MIVTLEDYKKEVSKLGFEEYPACIMGDEITLSSFVDFGQADLHLKIYLSEYILIRCFTPTIGDLIFPKDFDWFIANFMSSFEKDLIKPHLTSPIRESVNMITRDDPFSSNIIATTFMFSVVEFYIKY